jgi:hypothetical protein
LAKVNTKNCTRVRDWRLYIVDKRKTIELEGIFSLPVAILETLAHLRMEADAPLMQHFMTGRVTISSESCRYENKTGIFFKVKDPR